MLTMSRPWPGAYVPFAAASGSKQGLSALDGATRNVRSFGGTVGTWLIRGQCIEISRDKISSGQAFSHHQVGSPRVASLNLAKGRRDSEDLTERKEVLGEGKSIAEEGSRPVEESCGRSGESTVMTNEEEDFRCSHFFRSVNRWACVFFYRGPIERGDLAHLAV
jgi:hypothetical protein